MEKTNIEFIHFFLYLVLTRCQLLAIPGSLVTLYTSLSILTTKEQIKGFRPLLCHPVFSQCLPLHVSSAEYN